MSTFKRAFISIKRHPVKTGAFFFCVFLLTLLMSTAISMRQGIINTDIALREKFPAIATLAHDQEALNSKMEDEGTFFAIEQITPDIMHQIGDLPYVRYFNYIARGSHFFSEEIVRAFPKHLFSELTPPLPNAQDWNSLSLWGITQLEEFVLNGVHQPAIVEIQSGLVDLINGRTFTQEEIDSGSPVTIVSQSFLAANNLALGDILALDFRIYHSELLENNPIVSRLEIYQDENLLLSHSLELEIVGVFDREFEVLPHFDTLDLEMHINLLNRIYVPNAVVESTTDMLMNFWLVESNNEEFVASLEAQNLEDFIWYSDFNFLLQDPLYFPVFAEAATSLLPEFWRVVDLASAYEEFAISMTTVRELADGVRIGSVIAVIVTLSLLTLLFLRDRKYELGVYLALGEHKRTVAFQLLTEVLVISLFAVTTALFVGDMIASQFSTTMLRHEMIRLAEDENRITNVSTDTPAGMGFIIDLTTEDLVALYDTSLDSTTILTFYGLAFLTVTISTILPVLMIVKMNPKDVLTFSQI